jgi:hypothetical protein
MVSRGACETWSACFITASVLYANSSHAPFITARSVYVPLLSSQLRRAVMLVAKSSFERSICFKNGGGDLDPVLTKLCT